MGRGEGFKQENWTANIPPLCRAAIWAPQLFPASPYSLLPSFLQPHSFISSSSLYSPSLLPTLFLYPHSLLSSFCLHPLFIFALSALHPRAILLPSYLHPPSILPPFSLDNPLTPLYLLPLYIFHLSNFLYLFILPLFFIHPLLILPLSSLLYLFIFLPSSILPVRMKYRFQM